MTDQASYILKLGRVLSIVVKLITMGIVSTLVVAFSVSVVLQVLLKLILSCNSAHSWVIVGCIHCLLSGSTNYKTFHNKARNESQQKIYK